MSDARLRDLERRSAQGDVDAAAALIGERIRAGTLDRDRAQLAAYLGDAGARAWLALGETALVVGHGDRQRTVTRWAVVDRCEPGRMASDLATWGVVVELRAIVAAARCAWTRAHGGQHSLLRCIGAGCGGCGATANERMTPILATEAWIACPCAAHREACQRAVNAGHRVVPTWALMGPARVLHEGPYPGDRLARALDAAALSIDLPEVVDRDAVIRTAVRDALVPWALSAPSWKPTCGARPETKIGCRCCGDPTGEPFCLRCTFARCGERLSVDEGGYDIEPDPSS